MLGEDGKQEQVFFGDEMKKRKPKKSDQKNIEKAYQLLKKAAKDSPDIDPTSWAGACWTALVNGYICAGVSYEDFCVELDGVRDHYKKWFGREEK